MTREAFERFVEVEQESLRRFLLNLCGSRDTADDLAQEAFIKAYQGLGAFRGGAKASTWLFAIARNCFYDYVRRNAARALLPLDASAAERLPCPACNADLDDDLRLALDTLNGIEREAVLLFYMEDKSLKDIAAITGAPLNTIKSHLRRAKQKLKDYLDYEKR